MGEEWDKNSKEDMLAFEQAIHLVITKYKEVASEKDKSSDKPDKKPKEPKDPSSGKKDAFSALQRAVSKQNGIFVIIIYSFSLIFIFCSCERRDQKV